MKLYLYGGDNFFAIRHNLLIALTLPFNLSTAKQSIIILRRVKTYGNNPVS